MNTAVETRYRWYCDCGRPKLQEKDECCARCYYLDSGIVRKAVGPPGATSKRAMVIAALRGTDGMTLVELCKALGIEPNNSGTTAMVRTMRWLMRDRRVRRYWEESESASSLVKAYGRDQISLKRNSSGRWVYALDGRTEADR